MNEILYHMDQSHWHTQGRARIIREAVEKIYPAMILDVGCGTGIMMKALQDYDITGIDVSQAAVDYCRRENMEVYHTSELLPFHWYDLVLLTDVAEHVKDDVSLFNDCALFSDRMIVTVPAYNWMWSIHDDLNEHYRRYTKKSLTKALTAAGWKIDSISYFNTLLFPLAVIYNKLLLKTQKTHDPDYYKTPTHYHYIKKPPLNGLWRMIFESERFWLRYCSLPYGLSLIAQVKK